MILAFVSLPAVGPPRLLSQDPPAARQAGHSAHGEVFNEGPRQRAFLMGGTGKVRFPVTTAAPEAQALFDQGVGQLHGFWYFEAERTFRQVAALDPDCAMAYWGMAMANFENEKRAKGFIEKALEKKEKASRREALWIDGLHKYLGNEPKEKKARAREHLRSIEAIIHEHPDDIEAKAFLCVRLWQFQGELPIPSHEAVNALLAQIFAAEPMHPAHHYRIHLWDGEKPEQALASAARCGQSAPSIAHMWHMSGHIFSKLRRYEDAAWQQEAAARVDHAQMFRDRVLPDQIHNYAHNNEWLIRDLSNIGRVRDAIALAENLIELPRHPKHNTLEQGGRSASFGRERLLEVLQRFELWDALLACADGVELAPAGEHRKDLERLRAIGRAAWGTGDRARLRQSLAALKEMLLRERAARREARKKAREKAREEKKPQEEVDKAAEEAGKPQDRRLEELRNALTELRGHRDLLLGRKEAARKRFDEAKGIDEMHLVQLLIACGDLARAEEKAREMVERDDRRVAPLAILADILQRAGKKEEAKKTFEKLRELSAVIDLDVPVFRRLEPLAKELGHPVPDWRVASVVKDDVGDRPALDSLGPFRWHPPPAPSWTLPRPDEGTVSLADYGGKPVVVIFYLGRGCLHCVEQLQSFSPKASDFEREGISLVAVSSESREDLAGALAAFDAEGKRPAFPLVADPALEVFKAYRAFDDFEKEPLHGTFLVDGEGLVRWQDVSYEPFNNPAFLLEEARRLLGRPPETAVAAGAERAY
jgi:peroxiredoxin/tetratricopeptide (TPR) repeat protein